ncbi:MAG: peptide ABC transporter substrate-binding protein [Alphaproteobacteria bacterium]|nr:peptide ABC transporter substrate-binding protein [Alphaproteobacteria bacterium]MBU0796515.1 peptide ABC transporter substrate-binding protein [Alphaproteobacteria bacterium]MBU0888071.1 peptide ABC transporter substrate-binding protein [Alphaproteobacteria bacterium]MBU1811516.1 peptide ABC transporter substrate-binding protein [Alphaproteobacteria bacterium]
MRLAVFLAFALGLSLPAGGVAAKGKDELVIGITQFPSTLNPLIDSMMAKSYVLAMARRPFTTYDKDWQLACLLCTELPTLENGRAVPFDLDKPNDAGGTQGMRLTYTIQPEAKWGDGTPVTTKDVIFTWKLGLIPQVGVSNQEQFRRMLDIEVADEKTFTIVADRLSFDFAAINDFQILPAHLEEKPLAEPAEYRQRTLYDTDSTNPGLYNGPYRITQIAPGSHIVLEPNAHWWGKKPHFKRIIVRVIENTAALEANLLSGEIDYIAGEMGLSVDQALAFEKRQGKHFNILYKSGLVYEHIDVMLDNPILADIRVRQALILGIDRQAISQQLFGGKQPVAHSSVNPLDWVHDEDIPTYAFDPKRAAALLDEAGWREKRAGIRHNAAGEKLSIEFMTTAGNRSRELVQQALQAQWRQLGIDIRIRNEPARVFFGETVTKRKFTGLAMYAWISAPESVPRSTLHSKEIPSAENGWSGQNNPGFRNEEMDRLIDTISLVLEKEKRRPMWSRLQAIYAGELPALPLYFRADAYIMPAWLTGVEPTGHQYPTTLWVENWGAAQ